MCLLVVYTIVDGTERNNVRSVERDSCHGTNGRVDSFRWSCVPTKGSELVSVFVRGILLGGSFAYHSQA